MTGTVCELCGYRVGIRKDGTLVKHYATRSDAECCPASHQLPEIARAMSSTHVAAINPKPSNIKRQTEATLIVNRKSFKITSEHSVEVTVGILGPFETDDLISEVEHQFGVKAHTLSEVYGYTTYKITASDVPSLDRAVNHLEEAGYLKDPV